jgi:hypothetical protein
MKVFIILATVMLGLTYGNYYFLNTQQISIEIYSIILAILVAAFFFFLQRAYSIKFEEIIRKLSLVPEIKKLAERAKVENKELSDLKREKENLEHIIEISAGELYLKKRHQELKNRLGSTFDELIAVEKEIADLNIDIEGKLANKEIEKIEKFIRHREKGGLVFYIGKRKFAVPRKILNLFDIYPLGIFGLTFLSVYRIFGLNPDEIKRKLLNKYEPFFITKTSQTKKAKPVKKNSKKEK